MADMHTFTGPNYTLFDANAGACPGSCAPFTPAMRASDSFQTAGPLAPGLAGADIKPLVTAFSSNDGLTTYANTDANVQLHSLEVFTNATGQINGWFIRIQRFQGGAAPHPPLSYYDSIELSPAAKATSLHLMTCMGVGTVTGTPDVCTTITNGPGYSGATTASSGTFTSVVSSSTAPPAPTAVPTLSQWTLILLAAAIALVAVPCCAASHSASTLR